MTIEIRDPVYCGACIRIPCTECSSHRVGITSSTTKKIQDGFIDRGYDQKTRWQCQDCDFVFYTIEHESRFKYHSRDREKQSAQIRAELLKTPLVGEGLAYLLEGGTLLGVCKLWNVLTDQAKYITRNEGLRRISNGNTESWVIQDSWKSDNPFLEAYIDQQYQDHVEAERIAYLMLLHGVSEVAA